MKAKLRLIADDLTGALDTAAEFVGLCGQVGIHWSGERVPDGASAALDSGTREKSRDEAVKAVGGLSVNLRAEGILAYKKVDSLMRGHWAAELAACIRADGWRRCVVAPAFAYQGRRTEGGQQFSRNADGSWVPAGGHLVAALEAEGLRVSLARPGDALKGEVTVYDAATEADLLQVVEAGKAADEPILWCGSGGLAQALAHGSTVPSPAMLKGPVLGLFGSDQAVTRAQLEACRTHWLALPDGSAGSAAQVKSRLAGEGTVLVSFGLPDGTERSEAARRIAYELGALVSRLERPGTLIVAGGETLRALCLALGAHSLEAVGRIVPGLPCSVMRGGVWDGVDIISKSGAFGAPNLWRDLLREKSPTYEDMDT